MSSINFVANYNFISHTSSATPFRVVPCLVVKLLLPFVSTNRNSLPRASPSSHFLMLMQGINIFTISPHASRVVRRHRHLHHTIPHISLPPQKCISLSTWSSYLTSPALYVDNGRCPSLGRYFLPAAVLVNGGSHSFQQYFLTMHTSILNHYYGGGVEHSTSICHLMNSIFYISCRSKVFAMKHPVMR